MEVKGAHFLVCWLGFKEVCNGSPIGQLGGKLLVPILLFQCVKRMPKTYLEKTLPLWLLLHFHSLNVLVILRVNHSDQKSFVVLNLNCNELCCCNSSLFQCKLWTISMVLLLCFDSLKQEKETMTTSWTDFFYNHWCFQ